MHDELVDPPQDWVAIPLGAGQEPNAYGGANSFQWDPEGNTGLIDFGAYRRNPDETFVLVVRPPERP